MLRNADVVCLCEVPWSTTVAAKVAASWGYQHLQLLSARTRRFNLAILSKYPVVRVAEAKPGDSPFFHGVLCVSLPSLDHIVVCVTHLTPHEPRKRLAEARALRDDVVPKAQRAARLNRMPPVMVGGDFNALSRQDESMYARIGMADRLAQNSAMWRKLSVDHQLDFGVLDAMTSERKTASANEDRQDHVFIDLQRGAVGDVLSHSVPTERGGDPRLAYKMRLDYVFASRALVEHCPADTASHVLSDAEIGAGALSDHYPIEARLCVSGERARATAFATRAADDNTLAAANGDARAASEDVLTRRRGCMASEYTQLRHPATVQRCRRLSGLALALNTHRGARQSASLQLEHEVKSLGRCAVVGSSGLLLAGEPRGSEIDSYDTVLRLNAAPTTGFERRVGSFTSARLVNAPQSGMWRTAARAGQLPPPITEGEVLLLAASATSWQAVATEHRLRVLSLNHTFRKQCLLPLVFSESDRSAHARVHHNKLTPTFGFEAVLHALHSCDSVDVYGFGVPMAELQPMERDELLQAEQRLGLPPSDADTEAGANVGIGAGGTPAVPFQYHYWEARTVDKAADIQSKPWTYRSHNFALERARLRSMHCAGVLRLH